MHRRKKKFIRPDVQIRVILVALGVASLALLVNFFLTASCLREAEADILLRIDPQIALASLQHRIWMRFFLAIALILPLAVGFGIIFSFRFAGPIYRFVEYFKGLKHGRWDKACAIRRGDDFQDLCAGINVSLDGMRSLMQDQQELLWQIRNALEAPKGLTDARRRQWIESFLALQARHLQRFPESAGESGAGPSVPVEDTAVASSAP